MSVGLDRSDGLDDASRVFSAEGGSQGPAKGFLSVPATDSIVGNQRHAGLYAPEQLDPVLLSRLRETRGPDRVQGRPDFAPSVETRVEGRVSESLPTPL